jgi:16S rRNA U516 pseudouridylate synthase RsuA-like enzyme
VRRMLEAVGHPVTRLHRSGYAGLSADELDPGRWRELTPAEVEALRSTGTGSVSDSSGPGARSNPRS